MVSFLLILVTINNIKASAFAPKLTTSIPSHNGVSQTSTPPLKGGVLSSLLSCVQPERIEGSDNDACKLRSMKFEKLDRSTEPQLLSDFLMELGACSVSITDHDRDTDIESPIFSEPLEDEESNVDIFAAVICGDAAVGKNVWLRCDVTAHFPITINLRLVADQVRYTFGMATMPRYQVDDVPDRDWLIHVQRSWRPAVVSGFVLRFPWHDDGDVMEAVVDASSCLDAEDDRKKWSDVKQYTQLQLEGGAAFGTGEHPTTQLCLGWIRDTLTECKDEISLFLDYGSGSGVLGLAACALSNNRVQSVGVEIDPDAVRVADYNANVNQVNMRSYLPRIVEDDEKLASAIVKVLNRTEISILPESLDGSEYDACVANILARPLCSLVNTVANMVRSGGRIGLSGILAYQAQDVINTYSIFFNDVKIEKEESGWVLLTGTRK